MSSRTLQFVSPVVILGIGIAGAAMLVSARKTPERSDRPAHGPLVEVIEVSVGDVAVTVSGHGEVVPRVAVSVVPQVSGLVVAVHRSFVAGGFFAAGENLVEIEARDYELAVDRAKAVLTRAEVALEQEQAEAEVARREWQAIHPGEEPLSSLVVREPQIRRARAELESASADLEAARLKLERTGVSLPFDGVVVSKQVDVGQFVTTGAVVAIVYGTDVVEVRVPLESRELAWFDLPRSGGGDGPEAEVRASFAGKSYSWTGRVDRMEAELDPVSRMVHVVVEVEQPYATAKGRPSLLPGTFADVSITGAVIERVVAVPRHAVHEGDSVWVVADGRLEIRKVEIARAGRLQTLISAGLEHGEQIVISALDVVTDGMVVRPVIVPSDGGKA